MALLVGSTIGNYVIDQLLGAGGMGEVYTAHHQDLAFPVCVKVIRPDRTDEAGFARFSTLFKREAQVLAQLDHPNIIRLRDYGTRQEDGLAYLLMDYAAGGDLAAVLRQAQGPLPLEEVERMVVQLAAGLDYAHARHILHRDLKPQNVLRTQEGRLLLADFGLAKAVETALTGSQMAQSMVGGTAAYMAPEQCQGHAEYRSDLYSLGILTYQMLTGRCPFQGNSMQMMFAHLQEAPPPIHQFNPQLSPEVEAVVLRMLSKAPEERYQSATAFAQALHEALHSTGLPEVVVPVSPPAAPLVQSPVRLPLSPPPVPLGQPPFPGGPSSPQAPTQLDIPPGQQSLPAGSASPQASTLLNIPPGQQSLPAGSASPQASTLLDIPQRQTGPSGVTLPVTPLPLALPAHKPFWRRPWVWGSAALVVVGIGVVLTLVAPGARFPSQQAIPTAPSLPPAASTTVSSPLTLTGHTASVNSVAFSPDGRTLASGSRDNTIKFWDVSSGQERRTLKGHSDHVNSVAFSPDGRTLASGSEDNSIKLWDVQSGQELRTLSGHGSSVYSVVFSPDGRTLASGSYDMTIKLWDVQSGQERRTLSGHTNSINSVAFSPDGRTLASGSWDTTIRLWDVQSGQQRRTLSGHTDIVTSVAFSPDGRTLASGSFDQTIKLWDVQSGQERRTFPGHDSSVYSVAFSPDGRTLASSSFAKTIKLWKVY